MDKSSLNLQTYTDAGFADNNDTSSQLGYIMFLVDKYDYCQPLMWFSHKSKRVTKSVLGSEMMAFADGFDFSFSLKHDLQKILNQDVPLIMLTDSLSLFDVITKASTTREKRLLIDINVVSEAYPRFEINTIGFIRTQYNPADALTKVNS